MPTLLPTSDSASAVLAPLPVRRFTVQEYHHMGRAGVLDEDDGVELLEGWIVPKLNLNPPHSVAVQVANDVVRAKLPTGWCIRIQDAISTADSEPEPDLAIVRGSHRDYVAAHPGPGDIAVIVEVADSSLHRDRYKCRIYGKAGLPVYWILNLIDQRIEVCTEPTGPSANPDYESRKDYSRDDLVPVVVEGNHVADILAAELLP